MASLVYVVILNYNGAQFLAQFLPKLQATDYPNYQIIIGDNASKDQSLTLLREDFPQITCIELSQNLGFAEGYNQTLEKVHQNLPEPDYYVLLNSDVEVCPNWLSILIATMDKNPNLGICQPKIIDFSKRHKFEYAGASGGYVDLLYYSFCRGRMFTNTEVDYGQYEDICPIFWASGAAFAIKAKLFHKMGGFNPYFFAHQEEIDLCWRVQRHGYEIQVVPKSIVYHVGGGTLSYNSPHKIYLNHRNNLIMLVNNLPFIAYSWRIILRILIESLGLSSYYLITKQFKLISPIWKAHWDFFHWYLHKRSRTPSIYRYLPKKHKHKIKGIYKGIFIIDYFILGKRRFNKLNQQYFS